MEETRGYYQGLANRMRIDMDSRSPRLRLSVVGYLVDGGVTPEKVGTTAEWLAFVDKTIEFIGADLADLVGEIAEFELPADDNSEFAKDLAGLKSAARDLRKEEAKKRDGPYL